jgi:hypothetical protein
MNGSVLTCAACGNKLKLSSSLVGMSYPLSHEPPVEKWEEKLDPDRSFSKESLNEVKLDPDRSFSKESLNEVKEEYERRKRLEREEEKLALLKEEYKKKRKRKDSARFSGPRLSIRNCIFGLITFASVLAWAYNVSGVSIFGNKSPYSLHVGDCTDATFESNQKGKTISSIKTLKCSELHHWEVIYIGQISGDLSEESTRDTYIGKQCKLEKTNFLNQPGISNKSNKRALGIESILPSAESWLRGDRSYSCLLGDSVRTFVGHLMEVRTTKPKSAITKGQVVINCVMGGTTATITGINPKCPSGFKKK